MSKAPLRMLAAIALVSAGLVANAQAQVWVKSFGTTGHENGWSTKQTYDDGYVLAGTTNAYSSSTDVWVIKTDKLGNIQWEYAYGGTANEYNVQIIQTSDGGYVFTAETFSFGAGVYDLWIVKLKENGYIDWQYRYGGSHEDSASNLVEIPGTRELLVAGSTKSMSGGSHSDAWVLKLKPTGTPIWQRWYGYSNHDWCSDIQLDPSGGFVLTGTTFSFLPSDQAMWVGKFSPSGYPIWMKKYGAVGAHEYGYDIRPTDDGGYAVAGNINLFDGHHNGYWLVKLNSVGNIVWQKRYGEAFMDNLGNFEIVGDTASNGYILAGTSDSFTSMLDNEFWLVRVDKFGNIRWQNRYGGSGLWDYCTDVVSTSDKGFFAWGYTNSYGAGGVDMWGLKLTDTGKPLNTATWGYAQNTTASSSNLRFKYQNVPIPPSATTGTQTPTSAIVHVQY